MGTLVATHKQLEELAELAKNEPDDVLKTIANDLGITACAVFVLIMENKYNRTINI